MNDVNKNKEKEQVMATQDKKAPKPAVKKEAPKKDDAELARLKAKLQETDSEDCPFC